MRLQDLELPGYEGSMLQKYVRSCDRNPETVDCKNAIKVIVEINPHAPQPHTQLVRGSLLFHRQYFGSNVLLRIIEFRRVWAWDSVHAYVFATTVGLHAGVQGIYDKKLPC